jgi:hypothetical protein
MASPNRTPEPSLRAPLIVWLLLTLLPCAALAQNAVPIPVTGWNLDVIFEAGTTSHVDAFWDPESHATWAEAGVITGISVNGFPSSRTFTSTATAAGVPTNTLFQFQPYTGPNVAFLGGSGIVTMNLVTPAKYKTVNVLAASFSDHANYNHIKVTLGFTDHAQVDIIYYENILGNPVTFSATSWGEAIYSTGAAISTSRVGHSAALVATAGDPITYTQGGFGLIEAKIDLTQAPYDLQNYTLAWVQFYKPAGYSTTTAGVFAVSGTPVAVPQIPPAITGHPAALVRCEGQAASFTASASGSPTPAVQWQVSTNGGGSYTNVPGATSGTLSFSSAVAQSGNRYRAVFTNSAGSATSDPATLIVNAVPAPPSITPQPSSVVINSTGNQATGPAGAATYAWTISGGTITSASNIQAVTYTAGIAANVTLQLTVANASGCTASNSIQVPTYTLPAPPVVTLQPGSQPACVGSTVTFTTAASGSPTPTIQWQFRSGGTGEFSNLPGETSPTLTFMPQLAQNGNQYRATFSNPSGTATTNHATLTVDTPPSTPTIVTAPHSVLSNSPGNQASGPAGAASYAWSITNGTLTSASNLPAITYRAGGTGVTTLQLTVANATGCTASNSANVPIVILPPAGGTTAAPIALTGWNKDTIFELPNPSTAPSTVDRFFDLQSSITWAESGTITGKTVNGLPPSRTFVSAAFTNSTKTTRTNTEFSFQPYNAPNTAYLGTSGSVTLQLVTPAKYRSLNVLSASSSSQNNGVNLLMTLNFSDHAPVQVILYQTTLGLNATFDVPDWGWSATYWKGALTADRVIHSSTFTATPGDPLTYVQPGFGMTESVIDLAQPALALDPFTITSITFTKPSGDNTTNAAIFAVSGISDTPPPSINLQIADVTLVSGMATIGARNLSVGRGYIVQRSFDLSGWTPIDVFVAEAEIKTWSEPMPLETPVFYRLQEY